MWRLGGQTCPHQLHTSGLIESCLRRLSWTRWDSDMDELTCVSPQCQCLLDNSNFTRHSSCNGSQHGNMLAWTVGIAGSWRTGMTTLFGHCRLFGEHPIWKNGPFTAFGLQCRLAGHLREGASGYRQWAGRQLLRDKWALWGTTLPHLPGAGWEIQSKYHFPFQLNWITYFIAQWPRQ